MTYTIIFVVVGLFSGSLFAVWKANEERKAEQRAVDRRLRQRYEAAISVYPPPRGPKGFANDVRHRRSNDAA